MTKSTEVSADTQVGHSPAPWEFQGKLSGSENHRGFRIRGADDWYIADVMPVDEDGIQGEANARLMAAAPTMLEALETTLDQYVSLAGSGDCGFWNPEEEPHVISARAAIKQARGQ